MGNRRDDQPKRKRSLTPLGETEMEVLHHVWDMEQVTVADVHERVRREREIAYTTVMTVLRKLVEKEFLQVDDSGTTYVYSAARPPEEVRASLVEHLVEKVFLGSPSALVQALVQRESLPESEREEIRRLVESMEDG